MKHQLTLILVAAAMLMASCSRDFEAVDTPAPVAEQAAEEEGCSVSVEQALASLDNELAMIYGSDETRAAQPRRRIKAVHNVAFDRVAPVTRSAEMPDDVNDLFYIVEFADGQGSAVLGADKRVEPVVAILDETVLTPEDFASADIESDDITSYMAALMVNSAINYGSTSNDSIDWSKPQPIDKFWGPGRDTIFYKQAPLLKTKWHQRSPYNDLCYNSEVKCPAGCSPIAVAQLLMSNQYPTNITINGEAFSWNLLRQCQFGCVMSYAAQLEVARFVYQVGKHMGVEYHSGGSPAALENVVPLLNHVGYKSSSLQTFSLSDARNLVYDKHLAFYMYGVDSSAQRAHAWVIDGWNEYVVRLWHCYYDTHGGTDMTIIEREFISSTTYTKVHCNFGWGGKCDGYYSYSLFNTKTRLNNEYIDTSAGDYAGVGGYLFDTNFKMVKYTLQ